MKKLYYTCPIEAAYMAKNFRVKIIDLEGFQTELWDILSDSMGQTSELKDEFYYIHPDSFSIFEPQGGDMAAVHLPNSVLFQVQFLIEDFNKEQVGCIIQRTGKPFIMPQQE